MSKIVTTTGQNIYDISLKEYGSLEGVFLLQELNPTVFNDINERIPAGTEIVIDDTQVINGDVKAFYKGGGSKKEIRINTGDEPIAGEYASEDYEEEDYLV